MTNIVMLCHERPKLTRQALDSLYEHTDPDSFTLCLVDDASQDFRVSRLLRDWAAKHSNCTLLRIEKSDHVLARAKNLGVYWSEQTFGRGDWLYLSDSDVWFAPEWNRRLTSVAGESEPYRFLLWGGQIHPFHIPIYRAGMLNEHEVLDGPSWLMRWSTWYEVGGLSRSCAPGPCQSEEFPFCEKIRAHGGRIGVVHPYVVIHTGLTQSDGNKAPGWEQRLPMIPQGVEAE